MSIALVASPPQAGPAAPSPTSGLPSCIQKIYNKFCEFFRFLFSRISAFFHSFRSPAPLPNRVSPAVRNFLERRLDPQILENALRILHIQGDPTLEILNARRDSLLSELHRRHRLATPVFQEVLQMMINDAGVAYQTIRQTLPLQ